MKEHFAHAPRNATYRSKTIQNEIINIAADFIRNDIVKEIQQAKTFSLLADEVSDTSVKKQLSSVIRFVDEYSNMREELLGFLYCEDGTSGKAISDLILKVMSKLGINVNNCRGQGYDGAGNMSGKNKGTAARILEID